MARAFGGEKSNLLTGLLEGDNSRERCGKEIWLAQTFTIDRRLALWKMGFKCYHERAWIDSFCGLRFTTDTGKPFPVDLTTTALQIKETALYGPPKWRRATFGDWPMVDAGTYALVVRSPDTLGENDLVFESNTTPPGYTQGKMWRSEDSGVNWVEVPDNDLIFQVWGYEPPPPPAPPPVIANWVPLDCIFSPVKGGVKVVLTTDIPCSLYMRWTDEEPLVHKKSISMRGTRTMDATRFCFVHFHENQQREQGDTLIHTFYKYGWDYCETRWFYFLGTKQLEEVPSASPIFRYHNVFTPPEQMFYAFEPEEVTISDIQNWVKVDRTPSGLLKDLLPPDTSVVFLHIEQYGASTLFGLRPVGSDHTYHPRLADVSHTWAHVGVDDDNAFEIWLFSHLNTRVWLMGYARLPAVEMFIRPIERTFTSGSAWKDVNCFTDCPDAIGILVETALDGEADLWGLRMKGSVDSHLFSMQRNWAVIGCDMWQVFQAYPYEFDEKYGKLYITGYIKKSAYFNINAPNITPDEIGVYETIEVTPHPTLSFVEVLGASAYDKYALRPFESAEDIYLRKNFGHNFAVIPQDIFGRFEGKVEKSTERFYHIGSGT